MREIITDSGKMVMQIVSDYVGRDLFQYDWEFETQFAPYFRESFEDGCVLEGEERLLYCLIRALYPENIVEIGTFIGLSTNTFANAVRRNGRGTIITVDKAVSTFKNLEIGSKIEAHNWEYVTRMCGPASEIIPTFHPILDFVFEDSDHTYITTKEILELVKEKMVPGGILVSHDILTQVEWVEVKRAWLEVPDIEKDCIIVGTDSREKDLRYAVNCGLGVWKKP